MVLIRLIRGRSTAVPNRASFATVGRRVLERCLSDYAYSVVRSEDHRPTDRILQVLLAPRRAVAVSRAAVQIMAAIVSGHTSIVAEKVATQHGDCLHEFCALTSWLAVAGARHRVA